MFVIFRDECTLFVAFTFVLIYILIDSSILTSNSEFRNLNSESIMVTLALSRFEKVFPANLKGKRLGAVLHPASVLPDLHYTLDLLKEYDGKLFKLSALFGLALQRRDLLQPGTGRRRAAAGAGCAGLRPGSVCLRAGKLLRQRRGAAGEIGGLILPGALT